MRSTLLLCALVMLGGCSERTMPDTSVPSDSAAVREGGLAVDGGEIWYQVTGSGSAIPVILLHGGPGMTSHYLKPLEQLASERPVVRYDQLGGGKSSVITDTALFTIAHFVEELDSLRRYLGFDHIHILGHSWGTILAVEYYRAHPDAVASLVLGSPALDAAAWEAHAKVLLKTLPDSSQRAIAVHEAAGTYDAPDYLNAVNEYYARYVMLRPVKADLDSMLGTMNTNIYRYMWGPSEFTATGTLKPYDAKPFLPDIKVPLLYTVGEVDEAGPEVVRSLAQLTPGAQVVLIPNAAHMTMWDNPAENILMVREFLRRVDARRQKQ